ncbi:hypothetical protein BT69DRAFT_818608 [Atractiella rhizophila]|nr:hypothetical protein BT69DRAFT_818608 [Atractiella rhizophila]
MICTKTNAPTSHSMALSSQHAVALQLFSQGKAFGFNNQYRCLVVTLCCIIQGSLLFLLSLSFQLVSFPFFINVFVLCHPCHYPSFLLSSSGHGTRQIYRAVPSQSPLHEFKSWRWLTRMKLHQRRQLKLTRLGRSVLQRPRWNSLLTHLAIPPLIISLRVRLRASIVQKQE